MRRSAEYVIRLIVVISAGFRRLYSEECDELTGWFVEQVKADPPNRWGSRVEQADQDGRIAEAYRRFAAEEAHGRSPLYEELSRSVAADPELISFLAGLPREKQQPNLLLGAVRLLFGTATDAAHFRRLILDNANALRAVMLARSTQTNEPGRCATLLPILAKFPQPLALIEVGASAGLCLLPDLYAYDYSGGGVAPAPAPPVPVFSSAGGGREAGPPPPPRQRRRGGGGPAPPAPLGPGPGGPPRTARWA